MSERAESVLGFVAFMLISAAIVALAWTAGTDREPRRGDWLVEQYAEEGIDYVKLEEELESYNQPEITYEE